MFGNSTFYCWISSSYSIFRIIFYYGVLWLAWALTAVIYGLVWRALKNSSTNLNVSVSTAGSGCTTATTTTANSNIKSHARFISKATCYLVAFMLVRTPGTINRIQGMAAPTNPIFALYMLHALFSPMQGLLNMLVYYYFAIVRDQEIKSRSTTHEGVDQIKGSITSISKPPGLGAVC